MPHVFKRTKDGCGDRIDQANARAAGLTTAGLGKYPDMNGEAARRLENMVRVYGLPSADAAQPKPELGEPLRHATAPPADAGTDEAPVERALASDPAPAPAIRKGELFQHLLVQVNYAFEQSDIKRRQKAIGRAWFFDVCGLPLRPGKPLLMGLNWGVDSSAQHRPQLVEPDASSFATVSGWAFVARSERLLQRYFHPVRELNYLNVCPFRTPDISYLTDRDWQISIDNFLMDAIDGIRPSRVLLLGASGVSRLARLGAVQTRVVAVDDNGRAVNAHVGTISGRTTKGIPFYALPHPNNKIGGAAREAIWSKAFEPAR
jgi:hypothetical protein